jgi:phage gpG-like protein
MAKSKADTKVWERLRAKIRDIGKHHAKVGIVDAGATEADGTRIVDIAAIHEYGAPSAGIPERSFIRFTLEQRKGDLLNMSERLARMLLADKLDVEKALKILGAFTAEAIKTSIRRRLIKQDLAPSTRLAKLRKYGDENPTALVDTGRLINSITFAVGKKE